jgi:CheY-like chemotaxis protein
MARPTSPVRATVLVLLADRDADTRTMYAEYLRQSAYEVAEAEDGRDALAMAISRHPTVVVTATRLPGMSGLELCRLLRTDALTNAIPIIVVTGDAYPKNLKLAKAAGADAVLVKPCLPAQLAAEIRGVLATSTRVRRPARIPHDEIGPEHEKSAELLERSRANVRRTVLNRTFERRDTTEPPRPPPPLSCPACNQSLRYIKSHIGGASEHHAEQWDYFECFACGGVFEYRQRTRNMRVCSGAQRIPVAR